MGNVFPIFVQGFHISRSARQKFWTWSHRTIKSRSICCDQKRARLNEGPSIRLIRRSRVSLPPILHNKRHDAPSVFEPVAMVREARRQKSLAITDVPGLCVLDPDGDILRRLKQTGAATRMETWPCYHTDLYSFPLAGRICGIVACAVGAPFAVLVAEELFACGCEYERYIDWPNHTGGNAALFCDHRSSAKGRGD